MPFGAVRLRFAALLPVMTPAFSTASPPKRSPPLPVPDNWSVTLAVVRPKPFSARVPGPTVRLLAENVSCPVPEPAVVALPALPSRVMDLAPKAAMTAGVALIEPATSVSEPSVGAAPAVVAAPALRARFRRSL